MHNDLVNPTNDVAAIDPTLPARLARRLLVIASVVLAIGLTGVVSARSAEQRPAIVWILPGHAIVLSAPSAAVTSDEDHEADQDEDAQLAKADVRNGTAGAVLATPHAADAKPALGGTKRVVMMEVTAYCPCSRCCGPQAQGITASGKHVSYNGGKFVAADRKLAFGTKVTIPGYGDGEAVEVIDRGGAIKGNKLDVFFPTHPEALEWGRQRIPVIVEE